MKLNKLLIWVLIIGSVAAVSALPQQQTSGGGAVSITQGGNTAAVTAGSALKVDGSAVTQPVSGTVIANAGTGTFAVSGPLTDTQLRATPVPISGTVTSSMGALVAGTANIGIVRVVPSSCTQSTPFTNSTVGVATGAGTSITSTTTCVTTIYANNITNSPVTIRIQDKTGTPIIWVGGNADFIIPANSNVKFPVEGVVFTSGITAIAGTASAVNLQVNGVQ